MVSNSPWSEFWSEFPHFMGMGVVPAPSKVYICGWRGDLFRQPSRGPLETVLVRFRVRWVSATLHLVFAIAYLLLCLFLSCLWRVLDVCSNKAGQMPENSFWRARFLGAICQYFAVGALHIKAPWTGRLSLGEKSWIYWILGPSGDLYQRMKSIQYKRVLLNNVCWVPTSHITMKQAEVRANAFFKENCVKLKHDVFFFGKFCTCW